MRNDDVIDCVYRHPVVLADRYAHVELKSQLEGERVRVTSEKQDSATDNNDDVRYVVRYR